MPITVLIAFGLPEIFRVKAAHEYILSVAVHISEQRDKVPESAFNMTFTLADARAFIVVSGWSVFRNTDLLKATEKSKRTFIINGKKLSLTRAC